MKSTGIVRKVDQLGRLVIPMELRKTMEIEEGMPMEIFVNGNEVIFRKYQVDKECAVTGEVSENNHSLLDGKLVLSDDGAKFLYHKLAKVVQR